MGQTEGVELTELTELMELMELMEFSKSLRRKTKACRCAMKCLQFVLQSVLQSVHALPKHIRLFFVGKCVRDY